MRERVLRIGTRGANLLEVIMGASLFFLVSIFFLTLLPSAQWASRKAENKLLAETLVHSEIERLRGGPYSNLVEGTFPETEVVSNNTRFTVRTEISTIDSVDPKYVKNVTVTVRWTEQERNHLVEGSSYIGKVRS